MKLTGLVITTLLFFPPAIYAGEYGLSTSGKDLSLNLWFGSSLDQGQGGYFTFLFDNDEYENGDSVSICGDGAISGSSGSGTCSGHGGISSTRDASYERIAFTAGTTYNVGKRIRLNGGLIYGMYISEVNIGEMGEYDYGEFGLDFGISYKVMQDSSFKVSLNHETDVRKTLIGFWSAF
jgi:hypothetical protein